MLLRESKQFLFGCLAHILSVVGHSITVENYACFYRFTFVWCRYCVFCVFFMIKQVLVIFSLFICFAPHHEANPSPINRVFISFQQSMTWKKRHCNREAITKRWPVTFKQGLWDRKANPHCLCSWLLSTTSSIRLPILDYGFCSLPSVLILCLYSFILMYSSVLTYALTMSKPHLQFVKEGKLLWSSKLIIRVSTLCQRYVKETLSSLASRYLAKLNTLPETSWLLCSMETPLSDILAEDSSFDTPTLSWEVIISDMSCHSIQSLWIVILLQR